MEVVLLVLLKKFISKVTPRPVVVVVYPRFPLLTLAYKVSF
jgi:hypothetical protein